MQTNIAGFNQPRNLSATAGPYKGPTWLSFANWSGSTVPACGVMVPHTSGYVVNNGGQRVLACVQAAVNFPPLLLVNGPSPVPAGAVGVCTLAGDYPVLAAWDNQSGSMAGHPNLLNVVAGSWQLVGGAPCGLRSIGPFNTNPQTVLVTSCWCRGPWYAKATQQWNAASAGGLACNPEYSTDSSGGYVYYDGSLAHPAISLNLMMANQLTSDPPTFPLGAQDPNIQTGDRVQYHSDAAGTLYISSPHMDAKVGTVICRTGPFPGVHPGWAFMDGTANSSGNGGSGIDMRSRMPRATAAEGGTGSGGTMDTDGITLDSVTPDFGTVANTDAIALAAQSEGTFYPAWQSFNFYERIP